MSRNTINSRVFGSNVSEEIRNTFNNLQKGSFQSDILTEVENQFQDYLGDKTTFARMWTPSLISGSIKDENDKEQQVKEVLFRVINDNRPESYTINELDSVGVVTELSENDSLKPAAGITDINISTGGSLGAIKYSDISFVVFSRKDFEEIYLPFFMKPGATVILDYGWSDPSVDLYDIQSIVDENDTHLENLKSSLYGGKLEGPNGEVVKENSKGKLFYKVDGGVVTDTKKMKGGPGFVNKPNHEGKVDSVLGVVQDYSANWDGVKFNCKIKLVSQNFSILDKEVTEENDLKFIFNNKFEKILINFLTSPENREDFNIAYKTFGDRTSEQKTKIISKYFDGIGVAGKTKGILNRQSIRNGIFYQNYTADLGDKNKNFTQPYISYGLFEDLFLNAVVLENVSNKENYQVEFNSKDCQVRFEDNLYSRQVEDINSDSVNLPLFLYPCDKSDFEKVLVDSYNMKSLYGEFYGGNDSRPHLDEIKSLKTGGDYDHSDLTVIYLRDLFISTRLISQAFKSKNTINDVLVDIITKINKDSYGVFDLKMISVNKSDGVIGLIDNSLMNPIPIKEDTLTFDVYSERSIVSDMNYEFVMPKGGLASVLAIGESPVSTLFFDNNRDDATFIEQLNLKFIGDEYRVLNLPIQKEKPPASNEEETYNYTLESEVVKQIKTNMGSIGSANFSTIVKSVRDTSKKQKDTKPTIENKYTTGIDSDQVGASDPQDLYGKRARQTTVYAQGDNKPPPILPIELSLTIYGNTLLNIGNIISVTYLPDYLKERVFFIITNVENKIGTTWSTTYKCQMRLKPTLKGKSIADVRDIVFNPNFVNKILQGDNRNNAFRLSANDGKHTDKFDSNELPKGVRVLKTQARYTDSTTDKYENGGLATAGFSGQWCFSKVFSKGVGDWADLFWTAAVQSAIGELLKKMRIADMENPNFAFNTSYDEDNMKDMWEVTNINSIPKDKNYKVGFHVMVDKKGDGFGYDALFHAKGYLKNIMNTLKSYTGPDTQPTIVKILREKIINDASKDFQDILTNPDTKFFGDLKNYEDWNPDDEDDKFFLMTDYAFFWNIDPISRKEGKDPTSTVYIFRFGGNKGDLLIPKSYFSGMKVEDFVNKIYEKSNEYEKLKQKAFQEWRTEQNLEPLGYDTIGY